LYVSLLDQININNDLQAWEELEVAVEAEVLVNRNPARVKWCASTSTQENEEECTI
jgi:hypothetical protein